VGFAVPVDTVNRVVPQLIATGKYVRPGLGIEVDEPLNRLVTERLGVQGVVVLKVTPRSSAEAAGLRGVRFGRDGSVTPGDLIVALDGVAIQSVAQLFARFDDHQVGDTVRLRLARDGRPIEVSVTLEAGD
jgi:S1-C subfamily serine protease